MVVTWWLVAFFTSKGTYHHSAALVTQHDGSAALAGGDNTACEDATSAPSTHSFIALLQREAIHTWYLKGAAGNNLCSCALVQHLGRAMNVMFQ